MLVRSARRSLSPLLAAALALSTGLSGLHRRAGGAPADARGGDALADGRPGALANSRRPHQRLAAHANRDALADSRRDALAHSQPRLPRPRPTETPTPTPSHRGALDHAHSHGDTRAAHHRRGPRHPRGRHGRGACGCGPHARPLRRGRGGAVGPRPVPARRGVRRGRGVGRLRGRFGGRGRNGGWNRICWNPPVSGQPLPGAPWRRPPRPDDRANVRGRRSACAVVVPERSGWVGIRTGRTPRPPVQRPAGVRGGGCRDAGGGATRGLRR